MFAEQYAEQSLNWTNVGLKFVVYNALIRLAVRLNWTNVGLKLHSALYPAQYDSV